MVVIVKKSALNDSIADGGGYSEIMDSSRIELVGSTLVNFFKIMFLLY